MAEFIDPAIVTEGNTSVRRKSTLYGYGNLWF